MAPALTFDDVFTRLEDWHRFPKYQLERRVDIFLTFYLEPFFEQEPRLLRAGTARSSRVSLVAPEFPLLSQISELAAKPGQAAAYRLEDEVIKARTINVDYLLYRWAPYPAWLFVELKTDDDSYKEAQLLRYQAAQELGMETLIRHLEEKVLTSTDDVAKYQHLLARLRAFPVDAGSPIEIVYLAPRMPRKPGSLVPANSWNYGEPAPRLHQLSAFADVGPLEPANIWNAFSRLMALVSNPKG